jgi:hypothetical protein
MWVSCDKEQTFGFIGRSQSTGRQILRLYKNDLSNILSKNRIRILEQENVESHNDVAMAVYYVVRPQN